MLQGTSNTASAASLRTPLIPADAGSEIRNPSQLKASKAEKPMPSAAAADTTRHLAATAAEPVDVTTHLAAASAEPASAASAEPVAASATDDPDISEETRNTLAALVSSIEACRRMGKDPRRINRERRYSDISIGPDEDCNCCCVDDDICCRIS